MTLTPKDKADLTEKMEKCSCYYPKLCKQCFHGLGVLGFETQKMQGTPYNRNKGKYDATAQ